MSTNVRSAIWLSILTTIACTSPKQQEQTEVKEVSGVVQVSKKADKTAHERLSAYGFFEEPLHRLIPETDVHPYTLQIPLFSDYADKNRFIQIPIDSVVTYHSREVMGFPNGTVIIKNFSFPGTGVGYRDGRKIVETRLLIKENNAWNALSYIWNEEQSDAFLSYAGADVPIQTTLENGRKLDFTYSVPSAVQCKSCHLLNDKITPIGPTARQLNSKYTYTGMQGEMNQLEYWEKHFGMEIHGDIDALPNPDNFKANQLEALARGYLDINCAHCHRNGAPARNSGLNLHYNNEDPYSLGMMKTPVAAGKGSGGLKYDIVPGKPNESILFFRMSSTDPGAMMPEVGKSLVHHEGLEWIATWIERMNE